MKNRELKIIPSLICADLFDTKKSVEELGKVGFEMLHVDILDGHFSPSMPLGLETISQIRENCAIGMDVHIMSERNQFFVEEMISIGCERICFHAETTPHIDYMVRMVKEEGIRVGIALKPATPIAILDEIAPCLDYVLLMLINPGYAGNKREEQVSYAENKVRKCRKFLDQRDCNIPIEVDGRVNFENIPLLLEAGAEEFVGGSNTVFRKCVSLEENKRQLDELFREWRGKQHG